MRRAAWAWTVAVVLAAMGCGSASTPNTGPPIEKNPSGPSPMKPPGEGGGPSLPPGQR